MVVARMCGDQDNITVVPLSPERSATPRRGESPSDDNNPAQPSCLSHAHLVSRDTRAPRGGYSKTRMAASGQAMAPALAASSWPGSTSAK